MGKYQSVFLILFIVIVHGVQIVLAQNKEFNKIEITSTNNKLYDVLQPIQKNSGILIEVTEELKTTLITINITAENWTTAIRKLLEGFNHVETLNEDGTLKKVWILGRIVALPQEPPPPPPPNI